MKKIGLIGGMSWESSHIYYQLINEKIRKKLGGFHSAKCVLDSVDFAEIEQLQHQNDWDALNKLMAKSAQNLENAGADVVLLCTNTMHLCESAIKEAVSIPFLHIADATGKKIKEQNLSKVLLLGTQFTMEKDFYKKTLADNYNIETLIPNKEDIETVHRVIYSELVHGRINGNSKRKYQKIIEKATEQGAEGVILGCTEIPLLIKQADVSIPVFDTTTIHTESAVEFALGKWNLPSKTKKMKYGKHPSSKLQKLYESNPHQGANPKDAEFIFIGRDANWDINIESSKNFDDIVYYLTDSVTFWKTKNVHHPFLLNNYKGDGYKYHQSFSKIGLDSSYASKVSFLELLSIPTVGGASKKRKLFEEYLLSKQNLEHLKFLDTLLNDKSKKFFLAYGLINDLKLIAEKTTLFGQFKFIDKKQMNKNTLNKKGNIYIHTHFSDSISNKTIKLIEEEIKTNTN